MADATTARPDFRITHGTPPSQALLCGFSSFRLTGLTAVDFIVDHLDLEQTDHLTVKDIPTVTPFENGHPWHHTRLFSHEDLDVAVLIGELFVPAVRGTQLGNAILEWAERNQVGELAIPSGIPMARDPDEHRTFYITTDDYHDARLVDSDIPPMGRGFFDGTDVTLAGRGIGSPLGVGIYVTPAHAQVPDVEAAICPIDTANEVYDLDVDSSPLELFAAEVRQYYTKLTERLRESEADFSEGHIYI